MEPPKKRIHYGELDARTALGASRDDKKSAVAAGIAAGNINIGVAGQNVDDEDFEISSSAMQTLEKQAEKLKQLEAIRMQARVVVPVLDDEVKLQLRALGQPICLFGEGAVDRRDRLRLLIARQDIDSEELKRIEALRDASGGLKTGSAAHTGKGDQRTIQKQTSVFYTAASAALIQARRAIAQSSWQSSKVRLADQRRKRESTQAALEDEIAVSKLYGTLQGLRVNSSQFSGKDNCSYRPITSCVYSADKRSIATGTLDLNVSVWSSETCAMLARLEGHTERVHDVSFRPGYKCGEEGVACATASADQTVRLWKLDSVDFSVDSKDVKMEHDSGDAKDAQQVKTVAPALTLEGHTHRLSRVCWHPLGNWVASSSFDHTWRLWDAIRGTELLLQEGHCREVYGLAFHPDGSLVASGDLGGVARVWDVRSGRSVYAMAGHAQGVLSLDFSSNGYHLASASEDHTVKIWDLRKKKALYTIAAHGHLIPTVKFAPNSGAYLASCSFDRTVKLWSARDWSLLKVLSGHENKVMDFDIANDDAHLLTGSYDRTWKQWAHESEF